MFVSSEFFLRCRFSECEDIHKRARANHTPRTQAGQAVFGTGSGNLRKRFPETTGKRLDEIDLPEESVICLVVSKGGGTQVPQPSTVLAAEDEIVAITTPENEAALQSALIGGGA